VQFLAAAFAATEFFFHHFGSNARGSDIEAALAWHFANYEESPG
jgi:hypothetical protein